MTEERVGRAKRMARAGKRVWCDVGGHRWTSKLTEDGQPYLECRRCHLLRSGRPVQPA